MAPSGILSRAPGDECGRAEGERFLTACLMNVGMLIGDPDEFDIGEREIRGMIVATCAVLGYARRVWSWSVGEWVCECRLQSGSSGPT
jgi:hypothetical protein